MRNLFSIAFLLLILTVVANTTPSKDDRILGEPGTLQFTLGGHELQMTDVNWSPDGTKIVTSGEEGNAIIWDVNTGAKMFILEGHSDRINQVSWSPDGYKIATASSDNTAIIWDATTGKKLFTLSGHTDFVSKAIWTYTYKKVITISNDGTSIVWNASTGEKEFILKGGHNYCNSFNQIQYQNKVVTFFDDTTAIWDITTGKRLLNLVGHQVDVLSAAWSPDGTKIATSIEIYNKDGISVYERKIQIWDVNTQLIVDSLQETEEKLFTNIQWSPDNKKILAIDYGNKLFVWNIENCTLLFSYTHNYDYIIYCAYWSPNGDRFISFSNDEFNVFSSVTFNRLYTYDDNIISAKWSLDGNKLVAINDYDIFTYNSISGEKILSFGYLISKDNPVWTPDEKNILTDGRYIWDAKNGNYLYKIDIGNHSISDSELSPDGTKIAIAESFLKTNIWDFFTGEKLITLNFNNEIIRVDWSNDGKRILSSNYNNTATVWDAVTGDSLFSITGCINKLYGSIENACWNPNASKISSKLKDTLFVWDGKNGTLLLTIPGANPTTKSIKWSPDGKKIATIGGWKDSIAYVFDAITGNKLLTLSGHKDMLFDINWSPNGSKIVTASKDSTAIIWDANTGNKIFTLKGHNGLVFIANWSPDGNSAFTSGGSKSIIWDAFTGIQKYQLRGLRNTVVIANWSPDGSRLLTQSSSDMTAKVWYTDINNSIEEKNIERQNSVTVFPNPTENILNIKFKQILSAPIKIEIFDMLGSSIAESYVSEGTNDFQMDISNLSKGIYFLKINNEIQKIVKY